MAYKKAFVNIDGRVVRHSRIALVGVELEGAWPGLPKGVRYVDTINPGPGELGRDGSLRNLRARLDPDKYPYIGELPSPAMKESEVSDWIKNYYPAEVGPECGLHVHISVSNPLVYMWLMDDEAYPATVVEYVRRWAEAEKVPKEDPIWDRLAGNCIYCQHIWWPSDQVKNQQKDYSKDRRGHRYTAINCAFGRNGLGTIECRLLSMPPTWEQADRAVKEFISITNRYLVATAKREVKHVSNVVADATAYEMTLNLNI